MLSWQNTTFEIEPGSYYEMTLLNGRANIFYVINPNSEDVYVGFGSIPRLNQYEAVVVRNSTDVIGRPTMVPRVNFYNPSTEKLTLTVWFTYSDDFPFEILKTMSMKVENLASDAIKYDGVIRGVTSGVTLPTKDASVLAVLQNMYTLQQSEASTNQTVLEGINTILASL